MLPPSMTPSDKSHTSKSAQNDIKEEGQTMGTAPCEEDDLKSQRTRNIIGESEQLQIVAESEVLGLKDCEIAKKHNIPNQGTVRQILQRYISMDGQPSRISDIKQGLGISMLHIAAKCSEKLHAILDDPNQKQWRPGEYAIVSGITSQRGRELLSEPIGTGEVNWGEVAKDLQGTSASSDPSSGTIVNLE